MGRRLCIHQPSRWRCRRILAEWLDPTRLGDPGVPCERDQGTPRRNSYGAQSRKKRTAPQNHPCLDTTRLVGRSTRASSSRTSPAPGSHSDLRNSTRSRIARVPRRQGALTPSDARAPPSREPLPASRQTPNLRVRVASDEKRLSSLYPQPPPLPPPSPPLPSADRTPSPTPAFQIPR